MKFLIGSMTLALVSCTGLNPKTGVPSYSLVSWKSAIDGLSLEMNFSPNLSFYKLENVVFSLDDVEFTQKFDELDNYGSFFVEPEPEHIEISGAGSDRVVMLSGGDGGATFNIKIYIESGRVDSWVLSGSDIKDSPVEFHSRE